MCHAAIFTKLIREHSYKIIITMEPSDYGEDDIYSKSSAS